jgi:hypothetical protein
VLTEQDILSAPATAPSAELERNVGGRMQHNFVPQPSGPGPVRGMGGGARSSMKAYM